MSILRTRLYLSVKRELIRTPIWNDVRRALRWYYENNNRLAFARRCMFNAEDINAAFTWDYTIEGHAFWSIAHDRWMRMRDARIAGTLTDEMRSLCIWPTGTPNTNPDREAWIDSMEQAYRESEELRRRAREREAERARIAEEERMKKYVMVYD